MFLFHWASNHITDFQRDLLQACEKAFISQMTKRLKKRMQLKRSNWCLRLFRIFFSLKKILKGYLISNNFLKIHRWFWTKCSNHWEEKLFFVLVCFLKISIFFKRSCEYALSIAKRLSEHLLDWKHIPSSIQSETGALNCF